VGGDKSFSRRLTSRIVVVEDTWVYWQCKGRDDISRVRDLSPKGLFIETPKQFPANTVTEVHFLVQEGGISAQAEVRHARAGSGLGLKFISLREEHQRPFAALMTRLRTPSPKPQ
jgi:hypothetical protein